MEFGLTCMMALARMSAANAAVTVAAAINSASEFLMNDCIFTPKDHCVMPALVAGIHVFDGINQVMDGRDKPGHDGHRCLLAVRIAGRGSIATSCARYNLSII